MKAQDDMDLLGVPQGNVIPDKQREDPKGSKEMIQSIWQLLWLFGFSNSPGLAPFPGDLKWDPNVVCLHKDC